jgi:hypothetical protein
MREDVGIVALIGPNGVAALTTLDAIEQEFATAVVAEVAAAIDAGQIPQGRANPVASLVALNAIDISLFANTALLPRASWACSRASLPRPPRARTAD